MCSLSSWTVTICMRSTSSFTGPLRRMPQNARNKSRNGHYWVPGIESALLCCPDFYSEVRRSIRGTQWCSLRTSPHPHCSFPARKVHYHVCKQHHLSVSGTQAPIVGGNHHEATHGSAAFVSFPSDYFSPQVNLAYRSPLPLISACPVFQFHLVCESFDQQALFQITYNVGGIMGSVIGGNIGDKYVPRPCWVAWATNFPFFLTSFKGESSVYTATHYSLILENIDLTWVKMW